MSDRKAEAQKVLDELRKRAKQEDVQSVVFLWAYTGLDENDQFFKWLQKAYEERSTDLPWSKIEPTWDRFRSDPRFTALLKKMGLEQ